VSAAGDDAERAAPAEGRRDATAGDGTSRQGASHQDVTQSAALRTAERERDVAEANRDRFSFLAEVSRCLADSLDYEATLTTVAGMSLPYLDAWCIVDVVPETGGIRRLAVLHPDPAKQEVARELHRRYPPHVDDVLGAPRVLRTGRPEMVFDVSDEALAAAAHDAEHLRLLRALGIQAYVIVPMIARGRTLGAITFVTADADRRFGPIDVVMAEDLARRAAMAVDNARLYAAAARARETAEAARAASEATSEALREARDVAEAALRIRSEFLATMTHEVRTPLNAVVGYMELLEMDLAGSLTETQRTYVARTRDSTRHLLRLVDDVLDVARSETGRLDVAQDVVPAADTGREAVAILRPEAARKLVSLSYGPDDAGTGDAAGDSRAGTTLRYRGDEHRVRQILVNLLANAIKFTGPGGHVTLTYARAEHGPGESTEAGSDGPTPASVLFRVHDTGRGVTPAEAAAIFEPFVQGQAGLTRAHGGAGLGLTISRRLARLMGGDLTVETTADPGGGATFILRLPAADSTDAGAPGPAGGAVSGWDAAAAVTPDPAGKLSRSPGAAAARRGLSASAEALLRQIGPTVEDFVRRARADGALRVTDEMSDVQVADHLGTLLTDLANSLALLGEAGGEVTDLLSDGSKIQRLIGELHGAHRHWLGWSEADLVREAELLREACEGAISRAVAGDAQATEAAVTALAWLLRERLRAARTGYRDAVRGSA
jgi:signal transduction histidine kinase